MRTRYLYFCFVLLLLVYACSKEDPDQPVNQPDDTYHPTPYVLNLPGSRWFMPPIPANNPLTVEGVTLGRKLFYDPMLSADNTMSCSSCHDIASAFTDHQKQFSTGITGAEGNRNAMPLFNLGWVEYYTRPVKVNGKDSLVRFFWDGRAASLEDQVLGPITNPIEMNESLPNLLNELKGHPEYPGLFYQAFGSKTITAENLARAIAQFERTLISGNARIDKYLTNLDTTGVFTTEEARGMDVFNDDSKGGCFHCHNAGSLFSSDLQFRNNGHLSSDIGLMRITGMEEDKGKFRTPSLRNLLFTAPYMHDGRFKTLEEVVEFYNSGISYVFPTDPLLTKHAGGLKLTAQQKSDLVAFLKTFTDSSFIQNPEYMQP